MKPTTYPIDARILGAGEIFHMPNHDALPFPIVRRLVRSRQCAPGVTELLHGDPDHPGRLAYLRLAHGARILVPFGAS